MRLPLGPRLSLEYGNDEEKIHRLLLALSIFGEQKRFNFVAFNADPWTLEHIFPQNPKKLSNTLKPKDIALINSLIGDTLEDKEYLTKVSTILFDESVYASVKEKLSKDACELTDIEKEFIYKALKPDRLNSLGNMALLRSADNKSNSNGMFDYKRYNLAQRVSAGSFVPKHTYDVFSKLISAEMTPDLSVWTEKDIDVHEKWVHGKLNHITQKLNQI